MNLKPHQIEAAAKATSIIESKGLVYIFGQPRVGKSLISLEIAKNYRNLLKTKVKTLVFTKKMAIGDWLQYKDFYDYEVTNYEKVTKLNPNEYNFIIIDEAHNFGAFPKPSQRILNMRRFCKNKPVVFLSGTPFVESPNSVYSQLSLSSFSPFNYLPNGYSFFKLYGIPDTIYIYGKKVESYKKADWSKIEAVINPYVVKVTYEDAGIEYSNVDRIHKLYDDKLEELLEAIYKTQTAGDYMLENASAQGQAMLQYIGGFYKGLKIPQTKLEWLKKFTQDNSGKTAVMCYFIQEQEELTKVFEDNSNVEVYSSTKYCEGIDLSGYDNYVLYSFGYSGAKFIQLRDRVVNIHRNRLTQVHIPIIMNTPDEDHYARVKNKEHFNLNMAFARYSKKV